MLQKIWTALKRAPYCEIIMVAAAVAILATGAMARNEEKMLLALPLEVQVDVTNHLNGLDRAFVGDLAIITSEGISATYMVESRRTGSVTLKRLKDGERLTLGKSTREGIEFCLESSCVILEKEDPRWEAEMLAYAAKTKGP